MHGRDADPWLRVTFSWELTGQRSAVAPWERRRRVARRTREKRESRRRKKWAHFQELLIQSPIQWTAALETCVTRVEMHHTHTLFTHASKWPCDQVYPHHRYLSLPVVLPPPTPFPAAPVQQGESGLLQLSRWGARGRGEKIPPTIRRISYCLSLFSFVFGWKS